MKLMFDEHVKNRIVGAAVILSLVAIFLPALLKRANQPFDTMSRVALRIPAQPDVPKLKIAQESQMFHSVKVAKVDVRPMPMKVPNLSAPKPVALAQPSVVPQVFKANPPTLASQNLPQVSRQQAVEPLPLNVAVNPALPLKPHIAKISKDNKLHTADIHTLAQKNMPKPTVHDPLPRTTLQTLKSLKANQSLARKNQRSNSEFSVQVASLSSQHNAMTLVQRLKSRGYQAHYVVVDYPHGVHSYRVLVGRARDRQAVQQLQRQLARQMQLKGFVVQGEVG